MIVRWRNASAERPERRRRAGTARAVTDENGEVTERTAYRPFGEETPLTPVTAVGLPETKGFIGERFDDTSGLQYLNARYYDPKLAMFIQPDWWEVTKPGVGTNRYSYSFGDPVNGRDPGGHAKSTMVGRLLDRLFGGGSNLTRNAASEAASKAVIEKGMRVLRDNAVKEAWRQEAELVKRTGRGTRKWTKKEIEELLSKGQVSGYQGHHINNVAHNPELAGMADNIRFCNVCEHRGAHPGGYNLETSGEMINRGEVYEAATGEKMPGAAASDLTFDDVMRDAATAAENASDSSLGASVIEFLEPPQMMFIDMFLGDAIYRQMYCPDRKMCS
ncbi:RHS repeat-associated core domain-containing protein [Defluviimonas sp. SAOS-178_SWC]|uniref:RHS repeat-associated core domain-containing protein n=1 Tax=Defluviimonas sp. SAOS-178_SWC TaxID=3121287 RepID=UPI003221E261